MANTKTQKKQNIWDMNYGNVAAPTTPNFNVAAPVQPLDYGSLTTYNPNALAPTGNTATLAGTDGLAVGTNGGSIWDMNYGQPQIPKETPSTTGFTPYIQGMQLLRGAADIALGFKNLSLSNKQFGFAKDSFNKNLANQATALNNQMIDREYANRVQSGEYDTSTQAARDALRADSAKYLEQANRTVSGKGV